MLSMELVEVLQVVEENIDKRCFGNRVRNFKKHRVSRGCRNAGYWQG